VSETYRVSREEQDQYAVDSHRKAAAATKAGFFRDEILPVAIPQKKGDPVIVDRDESIREDTTTEALGRLKPAFKKDGTVTAGNAPGVNDGAAALVVMGADVASRLKLSPIARNFLFVLIDHRRITQLGAILAGFELIVDERLGFARAEVTAPAELSDAQRGAITAQLEQVTGKRMRTHFSVDPALIGGVVARIGSTVYDGSVRGQLQALGQRLSTER